MAGLLQLQSEARNAESLEAVGFVLVNQTRRLLPYRLAALWLADRHGGGGRVAAVSGIASPERDAPFMRWLAALLTGIAAEGTARVLTADDAAGPAQAEWGQWAPPNALWLPLAVPGGRPLGGLWLARDEPWDEYEIVLATTLAEGYAETVHRHRPPRLWHALPWRRRRVGFAAAALAVLIGMLPVRLSVLAPAEVVPIDPVVIAAPREGVVAAFRIAPNEGVSAGQPLFDLDDTEVRAKHAVAEKTLAVAEAEFRKASQAAFGDRDSMAEKAILQTRIDKARAELAYAAELLAESKIAAPMPGIAIFGDINDWLGKPVRVGERILTIADPGRVEILIWLPVADAIVVAPGADVRLFLNTAPLEALPAALRTASYDTNRGNS